MTAVITICMSLVILLAGVLVGIGGTAVVVTTSTVMNPPVSELGALVVAKEREGRGKMVICMYICITLWYTCSMN